MEAQKTKSKESPSVDPAMASCRKKKSDDANFLEDLRDHIDEFIHASMDEHKSCFKKTIQKVSRKTTHTYFTTTDWNMNLSITSLLASSDVWNVQGGCAEGFGN